MIAKDSLQFHLSHGTIKDPIEVLFGLEEKATKQKGLLWSPLRGTVNQKKAKCLKAESNHMLARSLSQSLSLRICLKKWMHRIGEVERMNERTNLRAFQRACNWAQKGFSLETCNESPLSLRSSVLDLSIHGWRLGTRGITNKKTNKINDKRAPFRICLFSSPNASCTQLLLRYSHLHRLTPQHPRRALPFCS